jgi:hypothetical protein
MKMHFGKMMSVVVTAILLAGLFIGTAHAIPAFSRQFKAECSTCHTIYPELNEYGEAFLKNSYVYSHAKQRQGKPAALPVLGGGGDPVMLEKLKSQAADTPAESAGQAGAGKQNEGLWLAAIPEVLPVSISAILNASYNSNAANNDDLDLSTRALVLHAGGNFREKAGFYASYTVYSEGTYDPTSGNTISNNPNVPSNNAPDVTELFLVWRHAFDTPINLKIGRMRPKLSLWKSTNKTSVSSYAIHNYRVGDSPFTIDAPEDAVEANAVLAKRLFVAAGVVDRNGQKNNEGYGHISYKFGGADYLGNEPVIDFDSDSIWDYLSIAVGAYGYAGRNADIVGGVAEHFNDYYRVGMELDLAYKKFRLRAGGVMGNDSNPFYQADKESINSVAVTSDAQYLIDSNIVAAFRYDYVFDQTYTSERHIYTPSLAYSPLQNLRIVLEYHHEDYVDSSITDNKIANLGITFSF